MTDAARVIVVADERGDFVTGDDGYIVWWPSGCSGAHEAWSLRVLADELDQRNAPWDAKVQAYFRDSGSDAKREDPRSGAEAEGSQSGAPESAHRPNTDIMQQEADAA